MVLPELRKKGGLEEDVNKALQSHLKFRNDVEKEANTSFKKAFESLYQSIVEPMLGLKGVDFDKNTKLTKEHIDEYKKIVTKSVISFFKQIDPSVAKVLDKIDDKKKYDVIIQHFDEYIGADGRNILGLSHMDAYLANGMKIKEFVNLMEDYRSKGHAYLANKLITTHMAAKLYHPKHMIAKAVMEEAEKKGYQVTDKSGFLIKLKLGDLIDAYAKINGEQPQEIEDKYFLKLDQKRIKSPEEAYGNNKKAA